MNRILHTLVASLRTTALSRGNAFVTSAGMASCHHGSRPFLRWTAVLALAAMALSQDAASRTASASPIVIDGGSSWVGWALRGNSRDVGIWGAGSTTRNYDLYTTVFYFDNNQITGNPVQVKAPNSPSGFNQGTFSQGAFTNGNVILGIGLKMKDNIGASGTASTLGQTFLNFGIGTNNYQAASSLGGTDGRTDNVVWGHTGDFAMQMSAPSGGTGPTNLSAMTTNGTAYLGTGTSSNLPGGIGSGVSYDYAARMFRQGDAGGSIQFLFDLSAMQALYGPGSVPVSPSGWNPEASARIGAIDLETISNLNLSMYNSNDNFANGSTVVVGIAVPEPSTAVLGVIAIGTLAFAARRRRRKGDVVR